MALVAEAPLISGVFADRPPVICLLCFGGGAAQCIFLRGAVINPRINALVHDEGSLHIPPRHAVPTRGMGSVAGETHHVGIPACCIPSPPIRTVTVGRSLKKTVIICAHFKWD